jgi:phenylacetate-coenzyme A ligase PaaK-like adenylate-forming protein
MGLVNIIKNYYKSLRCSQLSKAGILEIQEQRFRRLLRHTVRNSEYYRELYRGIDIHNCLVEDLPVLTKSAVMEDFDRLVTDSRLKLREIQAWIADKNNYGKLYLGEFLPILTSGSTGEYALVIYHRRALDLVQASLFARHPLFAKRSAYNHIKMLVGQLLGTKVRIAVIAVPHGNIGCIVKTAPSLHHLIAELKLLSLFDPIEHIVAVLNEFQPDCVISHSFFLAILAQEQLAGRLNIAFSHPMSFLTAEGEPLTDETKRLSLRAWNMRIQDVYGAVECYFMAASCQNFGNLHLMNDLCILEVVDGDTNPVPCGEYGERILVTNLANFVQPIIRYEIEDVAAYASQRCECGLPFPTLLPVQGRTTDFLYFKKPQGGYERFHPYRLRVPLFYAHEMKQYQLVQTARNELAFYYVPQNSDDDIEQQLVQTLEETLSRAGLRSRVTIKFKRVENIPRDDRSGKFQIVKSLGPPSDLGAGLDTKTY